MSLSEQADPRNYPDERRYPRKDSIVTVTYRETGDQKEFQISAGAGIAPHLCRQAGETGFLVLLNGDESTCIPVEVIERFELREVKMTVEEDG